MTVLLSLSDITPNYSQSVDLDGATYTLTFHYRTRDDSWTVDVDDANAKAIVHGVTLTAGNLILSGCSLENRPPGELVVIDSTKADLDPGLSDLGGTNPRVYLAYMEAADLE